MAFTKTPQVSTYQTKTINLLNDWESRDSSNTKDADAINCFYEILEHQAVKDRHNYVVKRDGTVAYPFVPSSANIRGIHYWRDQDQLFISVDNDISIVTASTGVLITTLAGVFTSSTGEVGFCEFQYDTNNVKIVITDGTKLVTVDSSNVLVVGTDPDIPTPHLPQPIFLNATLYLLKTGTADLYNSDLNDPLVWSSGNYITAEMTADSVVRVVNLNNYLVLFGTASIEYFWDAGNASGSPLQRYDTPIKHTGYLSGIAKTGNDMLFIGTNVTTGPQVYMIKDLKLESMGSPPIRRTIEPYLLGSAGIISQGGHDFYILTVGPITYALNLYSKVWTRFTYQATTSFPITYTTNIIIAGSGISSLCVLNGSATMVYFKPGIYQDNGVDFPVQLTTDTQWFGTYRTKTASRILIQADRPASSGTLNVSWSDDDYQTYNTPRDVELNGPYPVLHRLGIFRRRAFKFVWTENLPLRLMSVEIDLNMGQA